MAITPAVGRTIYIALVTVLGISYLWLLIKESMAEHRRISRRRGYSLMLDLLAAMRINDSRDGFEHAIDLAT